MTYKLLWAVFTALVTFISMEAVGPVLGLFVAIGFAALAFDMCDNNDNNHKNY
jgi:hypothetical protein